MVYLDTSVALSHLLAEDRCPPEELWAEALVSSRLLAYELWTRINARGLATSHGSALIALLERIALLELHPEVLARALDPFPVAVRTPEALHLASADFLRAQRQTVEIATYDDRMQDAARRMGLTISRYCTR